MSIGMWHEECARFKEDKAVVKLTNADGSFKGSVIVPTLYYPLNGDYEVFTYKNTEPVTDEAVLEIFDSVEYHIGHCYQNTEKLVTKLRDAGYDAKSYVGWMFIDVTEYPVHHCWCVLNGSVLDLSDDHTLMLSGENGKIINEAKSIQEKRELIASFAAWAKGLRNRDRCTPVGTPTPFMLYIGCECEPEQGRAIYRNLMKDYPDHECERNCDENGWNAMQKLMKEKGLM